MVGGSLGCRVTDTRSFHEDSMVLEGDSGHSEMGFTSVFGFFASGSKELGLGDFLLVANNFKPYRDSLIVAT